MVKRQKIVMISAKEAFDFAKEKDVIFIDLRSPEEFKEGHIGRAFLLSVGQIEDNNYCLAREYKYILYCNRGGVSMQAAALMADGEAEIYTLVGGMEEYEIFLRSLVDRKEAKL